MAVAVRRRREEHQPGSEVTPQRGCAKRMLKTLKRRLKIKLKIAFSFYQIATKVGETYMVVYPQSVESTLEVLSVVNSADGLGCRWRRSLGTFRAKRSSHLAPLGVLLHSVGWVRHACCAGSRRRWQRSRSESRLPPLFKHCYNAGVSPSSPSPGLIARLQGLPMRRPRRNDAPGPAVMSADLSALLGRAEVFTTSTRASSSLPGCDRPLPAIPLATPSSSPWFGQGHVALSHLLPDRRL